MSEARAPFTRFAVCTFVLVLVAVLLAPLGCDDGSRSNPDTTEGGGEGGTGDNPTPGCYGIEGPGITPIDLQGLNVPPPFTGGSLPGEPCEQNADCLYGLCTDNSVITQGKSKICVKKCGSCGAKSPACSWDDNAGANLLYTCVIGKFGSATTSHCGIRCDSVADCATWSTEYTTCNADNAGRTYCGNRDSQ